MRPLSNRLIAALLIIGLGSACAGSPHAAEASVASAPADVSAGRDLYRANGCALCHGEHGRGDGPVGVTLPVKPRDFHDPGAYKSGASIEQIAHVIATGLGDGPAGMPAYSHLSEADRRLLAAFIVSLQSSSATADAIVVRDAWVREPSAIQRATGAFLVIENHSTEPTALVSVTAAGAKVAELHRMEIVADRMTMKRLDRIPIGAGETVELKLGGFHVMLFQIATPYRPGDQVALTLHFSNGIDRSVKAEVRTLGAMAPPAGAQNEHHPIPSPRLVGTDRQSRHGCVRG